MTDELLTRVADAGTCGEWKMEVEDSMMQIRKAKQQDIPRIEELLYQVQKVHSDSRPDIFKAGGKKYTGEELLQIMKDEDRPIFVTEEKGVIWGYAFCILQKVESGSLCRVKTLYIDDLCVDEGVRGKKIGMALYQFVLDYARQIGCYNVTLNVWECNEAAKNFYAKCGLAVQKIGMEKIL